MILDWIVKVLSSFLQMQIKQMKKNRKVEESVHLEQQLPNTAEVPRVCLFCLSDSWVFCI